MAGPPDLDGPNSKWNYIWRGYSSARTMSDMDSGFRDCAESTFVGWICMCRAIDMAPRIGQMAMGNFCFYRTFNEFLDGFDFDDNFCEREIANRMYPTIKREAWSPYFNIASSATLDVMFALAFGKPANRR
ncbi:hypothetical protein NCC49_005963 [Naganishia albida]|nr:hypothetical protein NCC49_005963 [Naganishia albida]